MKISKYLQVLVALLLTTTFLGCGEQQERSTHDTQKNVNTLKLSKVLKNIEEYTGKSIVVDGNFFPACSDTKACCSDEFVLKSGLDQIAVVKMGDFKVPQMKEALPIRVTGILKETAQSPYLQATNVEVR